MSTDAWIWFERSLEASSSEEIRRTLERAGVHVHGYGRTTPGEPGLVVFNDASPRIRDLIGRTSRKGVDRVLAVAASGLPRAESVWELMQVGASDVVDWVSSSDAAEEIATRLERWRQVDELVASPLVRERLVGESPTWTSVLRQVVEVARFTDSAILTIGESGTGKELIARLVHAIDARPRKRDLVLVDCTTVVPTLSGSEFFGHERGAFTGAVAARDGAFALADGGTLFLDEVGELPMSLQAELLRVIQEGTYKRVGSNAWRKTSFRLVCATNHDLLKEQSDGLFRRDFYYRIAAWTCRLPPLRERRGDIGLLARHFLAELRPDLGSVGFDEAVLELLVNRDYPGNVRDLRQLVARMANRHVGSGPISVGDVPTEERPGARPMSWKGRDETFEDAIRRALAAGATLKEIGEAAEDAAIRIALSDSNGVQAHAARRLGVTPRALQMRNAKQRRESGRRSGSRGPLGVVPDAGPNSS